jgi:hypothetical protein
MEHTIELSNRGVQKLQDEQTRVRIMRLSAAIYLSIAFSAAILFFLIAYLVGGYPTVAKFGGMLWVGLLSLIISMPIVTARVKKRLGGK